MVAVPGFRARGAILAGAVLFSTGGAAIKACGFDGLQVAGLRSGVAAAALLLFLPGARSLATWRAGGWRIWLVGIVYAATLVLFVLSNKLTTSASAIFLQSTNPLFILLLGPLLLEERIRARDLAYLAALAAGLSLFFVGTEPVRATAADPGLGNVLALISGLSMALTIVGLRWAARPRSTAQDGGGEGKGSAGAAVVAGNLLAFLACLPWTLSIEESRPQDWLVVAYLGVFQIGLAYACVTTGMRRLPALETSLLLMVEPVLNPVWSYLVHGEEPGAASLAGGTIILLATALKVGWDVARPHPGGD